MERATGAGDAITRQLARELRLVLEAILVVEARGSMSVMVAGLQCGDAVLEPARRLALEHGVRLIPAWTLDEAGLAIRVEGMRP